MGLEVNPLSYKFFRYAGRICLSWLDDLRLSWNRTIEPDLMFLIAFFNALAIFKA